MRCSATTISFIVLLAAVSALATELPARKTGLWQMKMSMQGKPMPMPPAQHCIDAQTDKLMSAAGSGAGAASCTQQDARREGDAFVIESVCKMGPSTTKSRMVVTGDFNSAYKVDVTSSSGGAGETHMTIEATWLGPCKDGQKPGDIIMGNGMKMNVRDLQKMQNYEAGQGPKR